MQTEFPERYITLGLKIAYYRKKAGLTQEVLAERIGKSVNFVGQVEGTGTVRGVSLETLFKIAQGVVNTIMGASGFGDTASMTLPEQMTEIIQDVSLLQSIPLWAVTLLGSLFIWVLSLVMILTVYSRFFKLFSASGSAEA